VKREQVVYYETYPGNTVALKEVELRGGVAGYITGIFFKEGSYVRQGQKLYEIDRSKYAAEFEEAKANVQIAQANLDKVQHDYDRYQKLGKEDAIAQQKLDYAETDLRNAKMALVTAQSELVKARTDLDYSMIIAPFDGTVGISQVKMGSLVTPGQTLLNTISSNDPMGFDFQINQKELPRFEQLESFKPLSGDSTFLLVQPDDSIYHNSGSVSFIDRAVDPETGTIRIRLAFPDHDHSLKPGMTCDVKVRTESKKPVVVIPLKAIVEQMGEYFVFRVNGKNAQEVKIIEERRIGDNLIVQSGLDSGDRIVVDGIQKLRDGSQVEVSTGRKPETNAYKH
jgi:membrane fusion protein (multidrug efflux system)